MKLQMSKRLAVASAVVVLGGITGAAALTIPDSSHATDLTPTETQVNKNTDELANHEARITNTENNVKDLQNATGTPSSSSNIAVPQVSTTTQTTAPAPTPVTVASFEKIPLDANNIDCKYTYSDGTTYQWHWQTYNAQGSWMTDGSGNNGHWVSTTSNSGICDQRTIGLLKV